MITAEISSPGTRKRFVELDRGAHKFGADIDCDVVLPADSAQPLHFVLDVTERGVSVETMEGAEARLSRRLRRSRRLAPGRRTHWRPGAKLRIGSTVVRIRGEDCRSQPSFLGRALCAIGAQSGRIAKVSGVVLLSVGVVSVTADLLLREITGGADPSAAQIALADLRASPLRALSKQEAAPAAVAEGAPAAESETAPATPAHAETAGGVAAALTERGFTPAAIERIDGGWRATFYLKDPRARADLDAALDDAPFDITAVVHLETAMTQTIALVLGNARALDVEIEALSEGALKLTTRARDLGKRRALREILLSDVQGLRSVEFVESSMTIRFATLQDDIVAIWSGARPYVALKDGRRVKVGQSLTPGIELIAIAAADRLTLNVDGEEEEFYLK